MTIGTSILLIAVGAILKWAVTAHVAGINLQTAGTVSYLARQPPSVTRVWPVM